MRKLEGTIVSDKMQKTRIVSVERMKMQPRYLKQYKSTMRFKAHDENNEYKTGDRVVIQEIRPMSKDKRWTIIGKVEQK